MALKTVKLLIMAGNRENPCKGLFGAQSQRSSANRLMSTKKKHQIAFVVRFCEYNYLHECCLVAVIHSSGINTRKLFLILSSVLFGLPIAFLFLKEEMPVCIFYRYCINKLW